MPRRSYRIAFIAFLLFNGSLPGAAEARSPSHSQQAAPAARDAQSGIASFYGDELQGRRTASGRKFDNRSFTAASLTLPLNSTAEVTSLKTGLSVKVTIVDRGPFTSARVIDLSQAAAAEIGITAREGIGMVVVRPLRGAGPNAPGRGAARL